MLSSRRVHLRRFCNILEEAKEDLVTSLVFKTSGSATPERWVRFPSASANQSRVRGFRSIRKQNV
jgi:hypothetical protein